MILRPVMNAQRTNKQARAPTRQINNLDLLDKSGYVLPSANYVGQYGNLGIN